MTIEGSRQREYRDCQYHEYNDYCQACAAEYTHSELPALRVFVNGSTNNLTVFDLEILHTNTMHLKTVKLAYSRGISELPENENNICHPKPLVQSAVFLLCQCICQWLCPLLWYARFGFGSATRHQSLQIAKVFATDKAIKLILHQPYAHKLCGNNEAALRVDGLVCIPFNEHP